MRSWIGIAVLLLFVPVVALAGGPKVVGIWKLSGVTTSDGPVPKEKLAGGSIVWEFATDGGFKDTVTAGDQTVKTEGTWTLAGNELTVTETGQKPQKMTATQSGKSLHLKNPDGSVTLHFKKVKK